MYRCWFSGIAVSLIVSAYGYGQQADQTQQISRPMQQKALAAASVPQLPTVAGPSQQPAVIPSTPSQTESVQAVQKHPEAVRAPVMSAATSPEPSQEMVAKTPGRPAETTAAPTSAKITEPGVGNVEQKAEEQNKAVAVQESKQEVAQAVEPVPQAQEAGVPAGEKADKAPESGAVQRESKKEAAALQEQKQETQQSTPVQEPARPAVSPGADQALQEEALPEIVGIDTVNVESASGNWLLKRIWFERAQEQYEKIKALFDKVLELRLAFFAKRTELDRTLFDPFYMNIGVGQGELLEILSRLLEDLATARKESGALSMQENVLYEQVEKEKATLEQLQKDVAGVTEIDAALEAAINQLVEQVNVCRSYEKQAWELYKEIGRQLSDKKARELYYAMDTYRKNSADIVTYLQRDFAHYMQILEKTAQDQIDRIMASITDLKSKNLDFKEQARRLEQKRSGQQVVHEEEEEELEIEPEGIVARVWSTITGSLQTLWELLSSSASSIYHWIWPYAADNESDVVPLVAPTARSAGQKKA